MSAFDGRVAIVTGSTQGVGEALLTRLVGDGLSGAIVTGLEEQRGHELVEAHRSKGCDAVFVPADLGVVADVERILQVARERFGVVHHLGCCAGLSDRATLDETTPELFDRLMAVNVRAPLLLIQGVARMARAAHVPASVVVIGSVCAYGGPPHLTPYSMTKGALMTMTKSLAYQLMRDRIRVVQVNPGWIDTPGEDAVQRRYHGLTDGWVERAEATMPFGHIVKPDRLAATLAFVLSDEADLLTGAVIDYDQSVHGAGPAKVPPPN